MATVYVAFDNRPDGQRKSIKVGEAVVEIPRGSLILVQDHVEKCRPGAGTTAGFCWAKIEDTTVDAVLNAMGPQFGLPRFAIDIDALKAAVLDKDERSKLDAQWYTRAPTLTQQEAQFVPVLTKAMIDAVAVEEFKAERDAAAVEADKADLISEIP